MKKIEVEQVLYANENGKTFINIPKESVWYNSRFSIIENATIEELNGKIIILGKKIVSEYTGFDDYTEVDFLTEKGCQYREEDVVLRNFNWFTRNIKRALPPMSIVRVGSYNVEIVATNYILTNETDVIMFA